MALIGYWSLDGDALDRSGFGRDGTLQGSPTYVTGKKGQALTFTTNQRVDVVDDAFDFGVSQSFSVNFWFRTTDNNSVNKRAIAKDNPATLGVGQTGFAIWKVGNTNKLSFNVSDSIVAPQVSSDNPINDGLFHMATCVRDTSIGKLLMYIDKVLQTSQPTDTTTLSLANSVLLTFGNDATTPTTNNAWVGDLDEVRIFNEAVNQSKVNQLYDSTVNLLERAVARTSILRKTAKVRMLG